MLKPVVVCIQKRNSCVAAAAICQPRFRLIGRMENTTYTRITWTLSFPFWDIFFFFFFMLIVGVRIHRREDGDFMELGMIYLWRLHRAIGLHLNILRSYVNRRWQAYFTNLHTSQRFLSINREGQQFCAHIWLLSTSQPWEARKTRLTLVFP